MGDKGTCSLHYVCTRDEARRIIDRHSKFWISNCGCREIRGECGRSRIDVCLQFKDGIAINREKCYGCALCTDVCPEACIEMVPRTPA